MSHPEILVNLLLEQFPGSEVHHLRGLYNHVTLEYNSFILSDYDLRKMNEFAQSSGYKGYYLTPMGERQSQARHFITFHA
jgi:hypothetical protein